MAVGLCHGVRRLPRPGGSQGGVPGRVSDPPLPREVLGAAGQPQLHQLLHHLPPRPPRRGEVGQDGGDDVLTCRGEQERLQGGSPPWGSSCPPSPGSPSTFHLLVLPVQLPQLLLLLGGPGGDPAPASPGQRGGEVRGGEGRVAAPSPAPLTSLPPAGCRSPRSSRAQPPGSSRRAAPRRPSCWWPPTQRTCPGRTWPMPPVPAGGGRERGVGGRRWGGYRTPLPGGRRAPADLVCAGSGVAEEAVEEGEEGELEEQGLHVQVAGQAVQQAGGAVVGAGAVAGVPPQQQHERPDHGGTGEPAPAAPVSGGPPWQAVPPRTPPVPSSHRFR